MGLLVELTGQDLTLEQVVAVARREARVRLCREARERMQRSRAVVDRLLEERVKVYGLTTGFGSKKNVFIDPAQTRQLQQNLIRSHSCGVGQPLAEDVARATILLRANTLARGISGIRVEVVEALLKMLELGIYPWIPQQGSLGASGDLAPLSHLALVITGDPEGRIYDPARKTRAHGAWSSRSRTVETPDAAAFVGSTPELLRSLGLEPVVLEAKEGLALNNGTQVMTAIGLLTVADAQGLLTCAEGACAMSFEALNGVTRAFSPQLHQARPHQGQLRSAAALRRYTADSQILRLPLQMSHINGALRALEAALFHLDRCSLPLAEDIAENIRQAAASLQGLQRDPEAHWDPALDEEESLQRYRAALQPSKNELLGIYRSLLSGALPAQAQQAQADLAQALGHLEDAVPAMLPVQDSYSLRCAPQVLGAARQVMDHALEVLLTEANSATDNPLIFAPERDEQGQPLPSESMEAYKAALTPRLCRKAVCSGGNFHGEPVALVMDYLSLGISEIANICERRVAHLIDGHLNQGLPSLLVYRAGLNSGFMIPQYTAASLVSENKSLAHPASVDSIPSCENTEDHVSMGTIAARKARRILINAESVVAIELLTAFQALHFHHPLGCGVAARALTALLEEGGVQFVEEDRPLYRDIERVTDLLRAGRVRAVLEALPEINQEAP
jgi:histidine ammonia-lyase